MLENRLYKIILIVASVLSVLSIIGNIVSDFPMSVNWKWLVLLLVSSIALKTYKNNWYPFSGKIVYFLYLILVFLPFAYVDSGGSANNAIGYVFLLLICTVYVFKGWSRNTLVGLLILVFLGLHIFEYLYPHLIVEHADSTQFRDRLIQIPLIQLACFFVVKKFADAYDQQKLEQEKYRVLLESMNRELGYQANYDELTKLKNRRAFNEVLDAVAKERKMSDHELYVVLFDLDKFKQINDTLGHLVADEILVKLSQSLMTYASDTTIISRWGGDEFSMIIEDEKDKVVQVLQGIQKAYGAIVGQYDLLLKVSFGAAVWVSGESPDEILTKADKALYAAKENGRGQIVFY